MLQKKVSYVTRLKSTRTKFISLFYFKSFLYYFCFEVPWMLQLYESNLKRIMLVRLILNSPFCVSYVTLRMLHQSNGLQKKQKLSNLSHFFVVIS